MTMQEIQELMEGIQRSWELFQGPEFKQDIANAEGQEELNHELNEAIEGDAA